MVPQGLIVMVPVVVFQVFDHRGNVEVQVPPRFGLEEGDFVDWECAQFSGRAEVVETLTPGRYLIRKIS